MPQSVFMQKSSIPSEAELKEALKETYSIWKTIQKETTESGHVNNEAWHYSGDKFGWSYRISDKKRVIVYLLPRTAYFKVAFVFGDKAVEEIRNSAVSSAIKEELLGAKKYAEGRGIRIDVYDESVLTDLKKLLEIKLQ